MSLSWEEEINWKALPLTEPSRLGYHGNDRDGHKHKCNISFGCLEFLFTYVGTLYKYLYYKYYLLIYLNVPTYLLIINTWLFRLGCLANDVTITVISQMPRRHKKERKYWKRQWVCSFFSAIFGICVRKLLKINIVRNNLRTPFVYQRCSQFDGRYCYISRDICMQNVAHIGPFAALVENTMVRLQSFRSILLWSMVSATELHCFTMEGYEGKPTCR